MALPTKLNMSWYLNVDAFNKHRSDIYLKRYNYKVFSRISDLYKKQSGICLVCNAFVFMEDAFDVHHKVSIKSCKSDKEKLRVADMKVNLYLLHRKCHKYLHSNACCPDLKSKLIFA